MGSSTFNTGYQLAQDIASNSQAIADHEEAIRREAYALFPVILGNKCNKDVAVNEWVFVHSSSMTNITEGLHYAYKAITANTVIDASYLVPIKAEGVVNKLREISILKGYITNLQTKTLSIYKEQPIAIEVYRNASGSNNYVRFVYSANTMTEVERIGFSANDIVPSYSNNELTIVNNINGYVYYAIS